MKRIMVTLEPLPIGDLTNYLNGILHESDRTERNAHAFETGVHRLADVGRVLEDVGPDIVQQVIQRVLASEPGDADCHVGNGGGGDL